MDDREVFNTVKNHGYHIEHPYGHGVRNLSFTFFLHQIFELTDRTYQRLRKHRGSKKNLWDPLRILCYSIVFADWDDLLLRIVHDSGYG